MAYYMIFLTLACLFNFHTMVRSETYIVHVDLPSTPILSNIMDDLQGLYQTFLPPTLSSSFDGDKPRIIHSYHNVFKGFAATLTPEQVKVMEKMPGFISARPEKILPLHTTHTPNFLGLNQNAGLWRDSNYGRGVVIGVLDTGINPNHPSFNEEGMPPPPATWKGRCDFNTSACNNKLIGARYFTIGNGTPYDETGHGTHTASTAAGNFVRGANVFGNANGTAAGIAPLAHIATYKVCAVGCSESDVLAAMDAAIDDGVDIISLSLSWPEGINFYDDPIAMAGFSAIEKGIFVSASAGNTGPFAQTVKNGAPWLLTVGASSIDRKIGANAVLGNDAEYEGESSFQPRDFPSTLLPLVYPEMLNSSSNVSCSLASLRNVDVQGKIVLCEQDGQTSPISKGRAVRNAGGAAMILINQRPGGYTTTSSSHVLPATHLSYADGLKIKAYLNSTTSPVATISFKGTIIGDKRAPAVTSFSSRGPNWASPGILKPDIIGPGHNILAAWPISVENNTRITRSTFNIISGTSMSCPHLSGVAALLKNAHPDWSPAAIKSAIMTTADRVNLAGNPIEDETRRPANLFATGSGHVNVLKATNPGLVYDLHSEDYLPYLCGLNYTDTEIGIIMNRAVSCSGVSSISEAELNYPSFSVFLGNSSQTYNRTVTNVGESNSVFAVEVTGFQGVEVRIEPNTLRFSGLNQKLTYQTTFRRSGNGGGGSIDEGFLTWTSAKHSVTTPAVVTFQ